MPSKNDSSLAGYTGTKNGRRSPIKETKIEWAGYVATALSVLAFVPMIWRVAHLRCSSQISWMWIGLAIAAQVFWMTYGVINGNLVLIVAATVLISAAIVMGALKIVYDPSSSFATDEAFCSDLPDGTIERIL